MENHDLGSIKERIQKLLNMTTEKGCTEAEAQTALQMAQKLLIQYNIQMEEVVAHKSDKDLETEMIIDFYQVPGNFNWHKYLTHYVAKHNMCKVVLKTDKGQTFGSHMGMEGKGSWKFDDTGWGCYVFGRRANVEATKVMVDWIAIQLEYLATAATRAFNPYEGMTEQEVEYNKKHFKIFGKGVVTSKQTFRNSFLWGAINRINERLYESRKTVLDNDPNTKAIVLDREAESVRFQDEQMDTRRTHKNGQNNLDSNGYSAGRSAANTVSFGGSHHVETNGHLRLGGG